MSTAATSRPSARDVDPITWFTSPYGPLAFGAITFVYGIVMSVVAWPVAALPLQFAGVALSTAACIVIFVAAQSLHRPIGWPIALLVGAMSATAMVVSAFAAPAAPFAIELWWAPVGLGLTILSLAPYLAPHRLVIVGFGATAIGASVALALLAPTLKAWPALALAVIIGYAPALATVSTAAFAATVVRRSLELLANPRRGSSLGEAAQGGAAQEVERLAVAKLTARAAPFLESIATAGRITPEDRIVAGEIARQLRDELVSQSNHTWLEAIEVDGRLVVIDPDRRARHMNEAQRTVVTALIRAILDTQKVPKGALTVELAGADGGATAVSVSLDAHIPARRRLIPLAPYFLALGTAVDDLAYDQGRPAILSFRIAARENSLP